MFNAPADNSNALILSVGTSWIDLPANSVNASLFPADNSNALILSVETSV